MQRVLVSKKPTLLMLRALALGDFLAAVPAYRALARAFPAHHRVLAAPLTLAPLAKLCGGIDELADAKELKPLDADLAGADVAVNLHGCGPQSHRLVASLQPKKVLAFRNDSVPESYSGPQWCFDEHEVRRWCRLLQWYGIETNERDLYIEPAHRDARFAGSILLHVGAASEARRWPVDRWIALSRELVYQGWRVFFTGTASEFRRCRMIAKGAGVPVDAVIAGKTSLTDLFGVIGAAHAVICGDTGVAHVATATRTPSILLFGPTAPGRWGPPDVPYHRVIWRGTCGDPHGKRIDPGLASIGVDDVLTEFERLNQTLRAS
jgi:ADP-heptose:LPS heptosyltransferase